MGKTMRTNGKEEEEPMLWLPKHHKKRSSTRRASGVQCEEVGRRRCFVAGFLGKVGEGPACFKVLAQFPGKSKAG